VHNAKLRSIAMAIRELLLPLIGDATRSTIGAIEKSVGN
jgi:hypothetical protein